MTGIPSSIDAVIVGAGFAGLYMLHRMRGQGIPAIVLEAGDGVGGTWYWNRYPGARVDVESQEYCYWFSSQLDDEWKWTERYSPQPEILRYANHVADRFDLRRDIRLNTRVTSATFDSAQDRWLITTDKGDRISAAYCIMATGCLSVPKEPDFPGVESFRGKSYYTSRWPKEDVDFTGLRVGVIGTGSSAIQSIPIIAQKAQHVTVFQRTPNYCVPAHNAPLDPATEELWKLNRAKFRAQALANSAGIRQVDPQDRLTLETPPAERERILEERWARGGFAVLGGFSDMGINEEANAIGADFFARKIRSIVKDPAVAEKLVPKGYPLGTKRLCVDIGYFETFNRPNVSLVDVAQDPISAIVPEGVKTGTGTHALDAIVYAIGFDAMTGALDRIDIRGRNGLALKKKWAEGPRTYLGLMMAGFPNLFTVTGPGSPSVLSNMLPSIEHHVDWIMNCIVSLKARRASTIEATEQAENAWVAHVNEVAGMTLYPRANSWYMGANVPGKPRVFLPYVGGVPEYRRKCAEVAANGYEGFRLG